MIRDKKEVRELFSYPLLKAMAHRRTRRFPLGCKMEEGTLQFASAKAPVPLNDIETAVLCWAGAGITGTISADMPTNDVQGSMFTSWAGRTTPYACNVHNMKLFFTNDQGLFLYDPKTATKAVEIETEEDWDRIIDYFERDTVRISEGRFGMIPEALVRIVHWNTNKPGTTIFMPILDISEEYLDSVIAIFMGEGYKVFDDIRGTGPAGIKKWIDDGTLTGPDVPLSSYEYTIFLGNLAPAFHALQNIQLAAEAMGLGSIVMTGYIGILVLQTMGFRYNIAKDEARAMLNMNPVGLDGHMTSYQPPYYDSMDDAVDSFIEKKFGGNGMYTAGYKGLVPFENWKKVQPGYPVPSKKVIQITKDYCNYVFDTFGRFPATFDTIIMPEWLQVHHLEEEFYHRHGLGKLVNETHRKHMGLWHSD
ncbi:MAG: hypothetical protein IBX68_10460 [Dehalococcoidia bacterium]|nr:hypothetical protein [Dehalococcoidia bacterium]